MVKYFVQRDEASCAPLSILNLFRWLGIKTTYSEIKDMRDICCTEYDGTFISKYDLVVRDVIPYMISGISNRDISISRARRKYIHQPILDKLDRCINRDNAALLFYWNKDYEGHVALLVKNNSKYRPYKLVNGEGLREVNITKSKLKKIMSRKQDNQGSIVWFVGRR